MDLDRLVEESAVLHSKLVLLVSSNDAKSIEALMRFAQRRGVHVICAGIDLAAKLAPLPIARRALSVPELLRELTEANPPGNPILIRNLELLFDSSLRLDPLDLLRQLSRAQSVVAVWPGTMKSGRLYYAEFGHPEYHEYGIDGLRIFEIQ